MSQSMLIIPNKLDSGSKHSAPTIYQENTYMRPYLEQMADMPIPLFGYDPPATLPFADHPHARDHQHMTYLQFLARRQPDQKLHPNYPDVDIRDAISHYLIDLECPGVKTAADIHCQWTSSRHLSVSGTVARPEYVPCDDREMIALMPGICREGDIPVAGSSTEEGRDGRKGAETPPPPPVYVVLGERRIGSFRRVFTFPVEVEHEGMSARLEAGLLRIRVLKKVHQIPKGNGKVEVDVVDE